MAISKEKKLEIIKKYGDSEKDTGKSEVQIAVLTEKILRLSEHLKVHKKDVHLKVELSRCISKRKRFLAYLKKEDEARYKKILVALNLRK